MTPAEVGWRRAGRDPELTDVEASEPARRPTSAVLISVAGPTDKCTDPPQRARVGAPPGSETIAMSGVVMPEEVAGCRAWRGGG